MENKTKSLGLENFLFGFTRLFAICGALAGLIALAIAVVALLGSGDSTHVSFHEINTSLRAAEGASDADASGAQSSLDIPANIKAHFSSEDGENAAVLEHWLDNLSGEKQQQDFLDNLSDVIEDAEDQKANVVDVINSYAKMKFAKLKKDQVGEYAEMGRKFALYLTLFGLVSLTAFMSLILVALAIERNTRRS